MSMGIKKRGKVGGRKGNVKGLYERTKLDLARPRKPSCRGGRERPSNRDTQKSLF